jgi:hypothetical protein
MANVSEGEGKSKEKLPVQNSTLTSPGPPLDKLANDEEETPPVQPWTDSKTELPSRSCTFVP